MLKVMEVGETRRRALAGLAARLDAETGLAGTQSLHDRARSLSENLPGALLDAIDGFRAGMPGAGGLLLKGWTDRRPEGPTPLDLRPPDAAGVGTEAFLLLAAARLGPAIGFPDWHGGARLQNLFPVRRLAEGQSASNAVDLEFHTETAFRPDTPAALCLLCLRGGAADGPRTLVCDMEAVAAGLGGQAERLSEPEFYFEPRGPGRGRTEPKPIRTRLGPRSRYHYAEALRAGKPAHLALLKRLREDLHRRAEGIVLRAGDLLILDNTHVVHARTSFRPGYDGTDRWLQRVLIGTPPDWELRP